MTDLVAGVSIGGGELAAHNVMQLENGTATKARNQNATPARDFS